MQATHSAYRGHRKAYADKEQNELIHDAALDYYNRRMATCSSDCYVRIWDFNRSTSQWDVKEFRPHDSPVWRLCWAPPAYGHLLAFAFDKSVSIWEEVGVAASRASGSPLIDCKRENSAAEALSKLTSASNNQISATTEQLELNAQTESLQNGAASRSAAGSFRQVSTRSSVSDTISRPSASGTSSKANTNTNASNKQNSASQFKNSVTSTSTTDGSATWTRRYLADTLGNVTDCDFAPCHLGKLQLAVSSVDGTLRVYESDSQSTQWQAQCCIDCAIGALSAVSWCNARIVAPTICCCSDEERVGAEHLALFEHVDSETGREKFWKRVQLVNLDALRRHSRARSNSKSDAQTQTNLRGGNAEPLRVRLNISHTEPNLQLIDPSNIPSDNTSSKRRRDVNTVKPHFEVGSYRAEPNVPRVELAARTEDDCAAEPICDVVTHDVAFAPNFGRSFQLLAVATSSGLRVIKVVPLSGANFEGQFTLRPSYPKDVAPSVGASQFSSLPRVAESAHTHLVARLHAILDAKVAPTTADSSCTIQSRSASTISNAGSSTTQVDMDYKVQQETVHKLANEPATYFDFALPAPKEASRYGCECVLHDASNRRVWRVGWNTLGSQLAASRDDGRVALYAVDVNTQRLVATELVEPASVSVWNSDLALSTGNFPSVPCSLITSVMFANSATQTNVAQDSHADRQSTLAQDENARSATLLTARLDSVEVSTTAETQLQFEQQHASTETTQNGANTNPYFE